jgi:hypothetical protein
MIASSNTDEVIEIFLIYLILSAAPDPGVHSALTEMSTRNKNNNVSGE